MATRDGGKRSIGQVATASASADPAASSNPAGSKGDPAWKGKTIKRFRLVDELGEGAMGKVFVAEDQVLRRHVAMKLLPIKHRDGRPNHRTERLITEARSAATLEHPNVVTIYEIEQSGNYHYIAMELVEGGNLERLVQMSGPMEVERACQLVAEAAEALSHAHKRGIVHRDVKPANLLLTRSGRCKVCDFGLAMVETPENDATKMKCVGTPYFISPEVAMGKGATDKSDIYSLGCTLFFLLTGRPPFPGTSTRQVMKMHVNDPLPDITRWRNDLPPRLIDALNQACEKNPSHRFKDAEHFAVTLRTFTIPTSGSHSSPGLSSAAAPPYAPGSSAQLTAIENLATPVAIAPPLPTPSSRGFDWKLRLNKQSPVVWAAGATIATALLIALGMWLVRPGEPAAEAPESEKIASASAKPPAAEPPLFSPAKNTAPVAEAVATPIPPAPAAPAAPLGAADANNVIINGGLEEADTDDGMMGWFIHPRFKPQVQILREGSSRFIRLSNDDPAKTVFVDQKIAVEPTWKAITVSARMRASNFKAGKGSAQDARVAFAFRDDVDKRLGEWPPVPSVRTDSPWVERVVTADVPPGAKFLYVQLAIFNATGTADFDDVKVIAQLAPPDSSAKSQSGAAESLASAADRAAATPPLDLSKLGDWEDLDGKGFVRGWKIQERFKPQITLMEEGGNHFVRVVNENPDNLAYTERKIDIDPSWKAVTVSARMRAMGDFKPGSGSNHDGRVNLIFRDANGDRIGKYPAVPNVRGDTPWTVRTASADVPPGAKSLLLQVGILNSKGTVDFDDVSVVPQ